MRQVWHVCNGQEKAKGAQHALHSFRIPHRCACAFPRIPVPPTHQSSLTLLAVGRERRSGGQGTLVGAGGAAFGGWDVKSKMPLNPFAVAFIPQPSAPVLELLELPRECVELVFSLLLEPRDVAALALASKSCYDICITSALRLSVVDPLRRTSGACVLATDCFPGRVCDFRAISADITPPRHILQWFRCPWCSPTAKSSQVRTQALHLTPLPVTDPLPSAASRALDAISL